MQVCRSRSCGQAVRGRHPEIASDQNGASTHRLGERVKAAAHVLHFWVGILVRRVMLTYRTLRRLVRASPIAHTDETRVGEWGRGRVSDGVRETDRTRSYDAQALSEAKQQKYLAAHMLRSISDVTKTLTGRDPSFGKRLSVLLREAMNLRESYHLGEAVDFGVQAEPAEARCELSSLRPSDG